MALGETVMYDDRNLELSVSFDKEDFWLSTEQMATLFGVNRPAIIKHIGNIYKTDELDEDATCSVLEQVAKDGKKRNFFRF